jgi:hypothetical protein
MSVAFSTHFLFGITVGILLVILTKPILSLFQRGMRVLPLLLMVGAVLFLLLIWFRG